MDLETSIALKPIRINSKLTTSKVFLVYILKAHLGMGQAKW